jgi:hypothetical protein
MDTGNATGPRKWMYGLTADEWLHLAAEGQASEVAPCCGDIDGLRGWLNALATCQDGGLSYLLLQPTLDAYEVAAENHETLRDPGTFPLLHRVLDGIRDQLANDPLAPHNLASRASAAPAGLQQASRPRRCRPDRADDLEPGVLDTSAPERRLQHARPAARPAPDRRKAPPHDHARLYSVGAQARHGRSVASHGRSRCQAGTPRLTRGSRSGPPPGRRPASDGTAAARSTEPGTSPAGTSNGSVADGCRRRVLGGPDPARRRRIRRAGRGNLTRATPTAAGDSAPASPASAGPGPGAAHARRTCPAAPCLFRLEGQAGVLGLTRRAGEPVSQIPCHRCEATHEREHGCENRFDQMEPLLPQLTGIQLARADSDTDVAPASPSPCDVDGIIIRVDHPRVMHPDSAAFAERVECVPLPLSE